MTNESLGLNQAAADFDNGGTGLLVERTNSVGVLCQNLFVGWGMSQLFGLGCF